MIIAVDGSPTEFEGSIADLVAAHHGDRGARGIAVAVNDDVVARSNWAARMVVPDDRIEIVTAVPGG